MDIQGLEKKLVELKQPKFRLEQILKAVYKDGICSFLEITNVPKDLREKLNADMKILPFEPDKILVSADKKSVKAKLKLTDGNFIETVLLLVNPGVWSACLSSQAGCPMGCKFCATGAAGFKRNLTAEEITDQILFWKQYMRKNKVSGKISNIVYMGMGEPFLNWEAVKISLKNLTDKKLFGFGSRSISVSTVGIPGGIEKLAAAFPQVNLAISLHFCENARRSEFISANRKFNLTNLAADLNEYFKRSNRKVFLEYILFRDVNDSFEDARKLAAFIKHFKKPHLLHINLIQYNSPENNGTFESSGGMQMLKFQKYLLKNNISCTIRKSLGTDIQGACGQLAGK